jgi:hypothetical protein
MNSSLHIRRWRSEILVPRDCAAPERIRADLHSAGPRLLDDLTAGLMPWFSTCGGEVVLLRSLVFECELDVTSAPDLLVARWARGFAKALINAVESGGEGVLCFSSAAAYRAQFIADLASGHNGSAWYYRPYAGLAALPPAAAIRTLLLEDRELGCEILANLSPEVWNRLGVVLTRRETLRILDGLSAPVGSRGTDPAALAGLYREHAPHLPGLPWFVTALYLLSAAMRGGFDPSADLARWLRLAAQLPGLATRSDATALAEALQQGNIGVLAGALEQDAESWAALSMRPQWRSTLAGLLRAEAARVDMAVPTRRDVVHTDFGGLVLLLPELDNLFDEALSGVLPPTEQASPRGVAAWLVMAHCAGQSRAKRFAGEAFWRDVFGVAPDVDRAALNTWLAGGDSHAASACLAQRARGHARGARITVPLRTGGRTLAVVVDQASGLWCDELRDSPPAGFASPSWRACLTAARAARDDWRFLAMNWGLTGLWQPLFTHMAQIVLRRFAYRLPGFAGASLPYVSANFLTGAGTLDPESGRLQLARPPLHVLLNLIGMGRGTVNWSGPPERRFVLDYEA